MRVYNLIITEDGDIVSVRTFTDKERPLELLALEREKIAKNERGYNNLVIHDFHKHPIQKVTFGDQYAEKEGFSWESNANWGCAEVNWSDIE